VGCHDEELKERGGGEMLIRKVVKDSGDAWSKLLPKLSHEID
jgi:hypothetical protein